jgi:hypothetical protein
MIMKFIALFLCLFSTGLLAQNGQDPQQITRQQYQQLDQSTRGLLQVISRPDPIQEVRSACALSPFSMGKEAEALGKVNSESGEVAVSVISLDHATKLFKYLALQPHIPFRYPADGCYARAHEMSRLMEAAGVISAKVFIEGDLRVNTTNSPNGYVEWWYHVAPIVMVNTGETTEPYVFDPSIFDRPVPVQQWFDIQTSKPDRTYYTHRYSYVPRDRNDTKIAYDESDINDTKETMAGYLPVQAPVGGYPVITPLDTQGN